MKKNWREVTQENAPIKEEDDLHDEPCAEG